MGTELLIGDARVVVYFTWALWGYFLLRYYQYLRAESDLGIVSSFATRFEGWARVYVLRLLKMTDIAGSVEFVRKGMWWHYSVSEYEYGELKETKNGLLPFVKTLFWSARSLYYVAVHTPKATDHVLPFVLAIVAPAVSVFRMVQANG